MSSRDLHEPPLDLIMRKHWLISFIVHPDYILKSRERSIYKELLDHLVRLREEKGVWVTIPGEANRWWGQRAGMSLVEDGEKWQIEGPGKERARIAWASAKEGQLVFTKRKPTTRFTQARDRFEINGAGERSRHL